MYDISKNINKRMFDAKSSDAWIDERMMFEKFYKSHGIETKFTIKTTFYNRLKIPYIMTSISLKTGTQNTNKIKRISLVYYHGNAQNIFNGFTKMFDLLGIINNTLPDNVKDAYDTIYVDIICFEYPFYFEGNVSSYNINVLQSWDLVINYELRYIFDVKLPGERGTYDTFEDYETKTGNIIIPIGVSLGSGFLCRQFMFDIPTNVILIAPFSCIKRLAERESKKICLGSTAVQYLWNSQIHEYFPSTYNIEKYVDGKKKVKILLSRKDELCGDFVDDFYELKNKDNVEIIETSHTHNGFGDKDGLDLLASEIIKIIQNKENEKDQKELEGAV